MARKTRAKAEPFTLDLPTGAGDPGVNEWIIVTILEAATWRSSMRRRRFLVEGSGPEGEMGTEGAVGTEWPGKSCIRQKYPGADYLIPLAKICNPM